MRRKYRPPDLAHYRVKTSVWGKAKWRPEYTDRHRQKSGGIGKTLFFCFLLHLAGDARMAAGPRRAAERRQIPSPAKKTRRGGNRLVVPLSDGFFGCFTGPEEGSRGARGAGWGHAQVSRWDKVSSLAQKGNDARFATLQRCHSSLTSPRMQGHCVSHSDRKTNPFVSMA